MGRLVALRSNGSYSRALPLLLLIPAGLLALVYVDLIANPSVFPYSLAGEARASQAIVVVGPFVALSAAFEMRVLRVLWGRLYVRRPWPFVVVGRLWLVVGSGVVAMAVAYIAVVGLRSLLVSGSWEYPLVSLTGVLAWTSVGAALGLVFRPIASVPLALVVPYVALVFPGAWDPLWLRHLNGLLFDCCSTSQVVDLRAVVASLAILAACAIVSWMVIGVRLGPLRPSLAPLSGGATLAIGLVLLGAGQARHVGVLPASARPTSELQCAGAVCLWPEDAETRRANVLAWARVRGAWSSLNLPLRDTTIGPVSGPGMLDLVSLTPNARAAAQSMSLALPRTFTGCQNRYDNEEANRASDGLAYLIQQRAGLPHDATLRLPPGHPPVASDASALLTALEGC